MTGADVLILFVLLASTIIGLLRGFVREAVSLVFWVVAHLGRLGFRSGGRTAPRRPAGRAGGAPWVGRIVVLIAVLLIGVVFGMLLGHFMRQIGLGILDRAMGMMFGLARGMVLVGLLIIGGELLQSES